MRLSLRAASSISCGLLRLPALDPDIDRVIRPMAVEARGRAGGSPATGLPPTAAGTGPPSGTPSPASGLPEVGEREGVRPALGVTVSGTVSGGAIGVTGAQDPPRTAHLRQIEVAMLHARAY